jgi:hypothetical protein
MDNIYKFLNPDNVYIHNFFLMFDLVIVEMIFSIVLGTDSVALKCTYFKQEHEKALKTHYF